MINTILNDPEKLLFLAISLVILVDSITALVLFYCSNKFVSNARKVRAQITKLESSQRGQKAFLIFNDPMVGDIETSIIVPMNKFRENEEIEILSDKSDPTKVKLSSFSSVWLVPFAALQAAIFLAIGLIIMVSQGLAEVPFSY